MLHLLKIEWLKVKSHKVFWILLALTAISMVGINYVVYSIQTSDVGKLAVSTLGNPYGYPMVWNTVSYVASFLLFIPGLIMLINMSNEYSFRTVRQNIIDGTSRTQFIFVKMLVALIIATITTLFVFIAVLVFGATQPAAFSFSGIKYVFYFFIQACSYTCVAFFFSILFKRQGLGIGIYFLYVFVLENIISTVMSRYLGKIGSILPLESSDRLIGFPFKDVKIFESPSEGVLLAVALAYMAIILIFCKFKFEKDDL